MHLRLLLALVLALSVASPGAHGKGRHRAVARKAKVERKQARRLRRPVPERSRPALSRIQKLVNPWKKLTRKQRKFIKRQARSKLRWIRARGKLFERVTQKRDYSRDYVLFRNSKVTGFLDWSDPRHPQYDPTRKTGEQHLLDPIPESRRAHILVVPNRPREHIAQNLGDQITLSDLDAAQQTMKEAHALASKLGIAKPKIWINSPDRISVGYLHVHIIGERQKPYPPALQSPDQAR